MNRNIGAPVQPRSPQPCASGSSWESGRPAPGHPVDTSLPPHRNRAGPPPPHARAHNADPGSPPSGRAVGGGGAQGPKRPTQRSKAPPRGRPAAAPTTPSQVGGNRDRAAPPPSTPDGARDRGRTRGGARTTWNGPTRAQCRDHARCARHTTQRAHTHEKDTRGLPEGQPDRARGTHRPHGMAYQRARVRDTRTGRPATRSAEHAGREGGRRGDTTPGTGPNPPEPAASAAHTQTGHCTRQGSSGAQRHAPAPRLGSLRASPRGSHWRQASSTGPAAPAPRATTH